MFVPSNLLHCSPRHDHGHIVARIWTNNNLPEASQKSSIRTKIWTVPIWNCHGCSRHFRAEKDRKNMKKRWIFDPHSLFSCRPYCPLVYFLGGWLGECRLVCFENLGPPNFTHKWFIQVSNSWIIGSQILRYTDINVPSHWTWKTCFFLQPKEKSWNLPMENGWLIRQLGNHRKITLPHPTPNLQRKGAFQEISNGRTHWTDPTWVSNNSSNLLRGPLVRSYSIFDGCIHFSSEKKQLHPLYRFIIETLVVAFENAIRKWVLKTPYIPQNNRGHQFHCSIGDCKASKYALVLQS